jgi:WD domain, G-beta repeat
MVSLSWGGVVRRGGNLGGKLWEVATGRCLRTLQVDTGWVDSVCLSTDGRWVLAGGRSGMWLWETATGRCLRTFQYYTGGVCSVCLSIDGRLALSGGWHGDIRLWEVTTGRCLRIFQGHTSSVISVNLSSDSRWMLSGASDSMRLWEVTTGRCVRVFPSHTQSIRAVSLSSDGTFALCGNAGGDRNQDTNIKLWKLDWELGTPPADWERQILPYLEVFLTRHIPYAGKLPNWRKPFAGEIQQALTRQGKPSWNAQDFQELLRQLHHAGYGWLHPERIHQKLGELAASWQGPPPLTCTI